MKLSILLPLALSLLIPRLNARDDWISVSPVARPGELPETIDIGVLATYGEEYRGRLVIVSGTLDEASFEDVGGTQRGSARLRLRNHRMDLLFLPETSRVDLSREISQLEDEQVEVIARFAERAAGRRVYGLVVDSIRRAGDGDEGGGELADIPRSTRSRPPRLDSTYPEIGAQSIRLGVEFRLSFTEDMDPESFNGRVLLRYPRPPEGIEASHGFELEYEEASRTLVVRPEGELAPGREVQIQLLRGITGVDGKTLSRLDDDSAKEMTSRRSAGGVSANDVVATLRFYTRRR